MAAICISVQTLLVADEVPCLVQLKTECRDGVTSCPKTLPCEVSFSTTEVTGNTYFATGEFNPSA